MNGLVQNLVDMALTTLIEKAVVYQIIDPVLLDTTTIQVMANVNAPEEIVEPVDTGIPTQDLVNQDVIVVVVDSSGATITTDV